MKYKTEEQNFGYDLMYLKSTNWIAIYPICNIKILFSLRKVYLL